MSEAGPSVAVIILTLNEEKNLPFAIESAKGACDELFVVDSYSSDSTASLARQAGCTVVQNAFIDYAKQRNFALDNLPIRSEWIFFLDADERLSPELKKEIAEVVARRPEVNGFYVKWRL